MKILLDMNLSPKWIGHLEQAGIESAHWSSLGDPRAPDREIFEFASAGGWVIFTHDLDFSHILAATGAHGPSVLQLRGHDVLPAAVGRIVTRVLEVHRRALVEGAVVVINPDGARVRLLPLTGSST